MARRFGTLFAAVLALVASACASEMTGPPATDPPATATTSVATTAVTTTTAATTPTTTTTTTVSPTAPSTAPPTAPPTVPSTAPPTVPPTTTPTRPAEVVNRGTSGRHEIALTFDAGSDVGAAAAILDLLAAEGIRASFGITGAWANANPALIARMANEGHVLINHTDSHPDMTTITTAARLAELAAADEAVRAITGRTMQPYFRPPYGASDTSVLRDVALAGYRYSIMWTIDSLGWKSTDPAQVTARCLDRAVDGAIILMHVGSLSTDIDALPDVITGLRAEGYAFVTITQMLG